MIRDRIDHCPNCQTEILDNYCPHCGEKRLTDKDFRFKQLMHQLFSALTDVNGKFLRTLILLMLQPGQLTRDHLAGIRKSRINPIQLFVFVNLIYFLMVSFTHINTFSTPLNVHINASNFIHQPLAQSLVENKLSEESMEYSEYEQSFNQKIELRSKALVFLMIPLVFLLMLVLSGSHSKRPYLNLVSAIHFMAWLMVLLILVNAILVGMHWVFHSFSMSNLSQILVSDLTTSLVLAACIIFYYYAYSSRWEPNKSVLARGLKSFVFMLGIYLSVLIYRMCLFFITFYF